MELHLPNGLYLLKKPNVYCKSLVLVEMQKISNAYNELNRDSKGQNIVKTIDGARNVSIGYKIVDFSWSDVQSNSINFSRMDSFFFYFFTARYGKVLPSKFYRNKICCSLRGNFDKRNVKILFEKRTISRRVDNTLH